MKQKRAKKKAKDDDKDKKNDDDEARKAEKERDDKVAVFCSSIFIQYANQLQIKALSADTVADDGPRIFALHRYDSMFPCGGTFTDLTADRNFYQMRIERLRNIEVARRNQQRIKDPTFFPKAPTGDLP